MSFAIAALGSTAIPSDRCIEIILGLLTDNKLSHKFCSQYFLCSGHKDIEEPVQGASPSWDTAARFGRDSEGCARIEAGKEIFKIINTWKSTWKICDILMSIHPSNSFGRIAGREEWKVRRNNIRFELFGSDLAEKSLFSRCPPSLFPPK